MPGAIIGVEDSVVKEERILPSQSFYSRGGNRETENSQVNK